MLALVFLPFLASVAKFEAQVDPVPNSKFDYMQNFEECPKMQAKYFENLQPKGGSDKDKITYLKKNSPQSKEECVQLCCNLPNCNIAFMIFNESVSRLTCFHVSIKARINTFMFSVGFYNLK